MHFAGQLFFPFVVLGQCENVGLFGWWLGGAAGGRRLQAGDAGSWLVGSGVYVLGVVLVGFDSGLESGMVCIDLVTTIRQTPIVRINRRDLLPTLNRLIPRAYTLIRTQIILRRMRVRQQNIRFLRFI